MIDAICGMNYLFQMKQKSVTIKYKFNRLLAQINSNMNATEAKRKLCELRSSLRDKEADKAIWIAIRAIDTCTKNGFIVED